MTMAKYDNAIKQLRKIKFEPKVKLYCIKCENMIILVLFFEEQEANRINGIQELRDRIMEVSRQGPYMGEKIPVR